MTGGFRVSWRSTSLSTIIVVRMHDRMPMRFLWLTDVGNNRFPCGRRSCTTRGRPGCNTSVHAYEPAISQRIVSSALQSNAEFALLCFV